MGNTVWIIEAATSPSDVWIDRVCASKELAFAYLEAFAQRPRNRDGKLSDYWRANGTDYTVHEWEVVAA